MFSMKPTAANGNDPVKEESMRELTKNLFSFSWAMSLFGAKQMTSLLDPREALKGAPGTAQALGNVTEAMLDEFGDGLRQTFQVGEKVQGEILDAFFGVLGVQPGTGGVKTTPSGLPHPPPIFDAKSAAGEEVMITYTRGTGTFSDNKEYIALSNQIFNLDGTPNGLHEGVWQALFKSPEELLARPAPPTGPMNQPVGPVPSYPVSANTIAKWTHADGSSISSVGPAASHLIPLSDGSFLFLVITAQIITEGTGRFAGANGLTQSLGATHVPAGVDLFSGGGPPTFPAMTLDSFKFVTASQTGGGPGGGHGGGPSGGHSPGGRPGTGGQGGNWNGCGCLAAENLEPASKFVDVLGSSMHYLDVGSGKPVIFLHGNPTWSYLWRNVLPHVAPGSRCIAPDLIGMGMSAKPEIEYSFFDHARFFDAFVEALDLDEYALVLHDQGSLIGFYHAMRYEKKVRGLAFMEAMLQPYARWADFPTPLIPPFKAYRDPVKGYQLIVEENVFIEKQLPGGTITTLDEATMDCYRGPFLNPPSRELIQKFAQSLPVAGDPEDVADATGEYARWLRRTNIPKLFLWGEPGLINTEKDVDWARENFKNLQTSYLGDGIHFYQEDHPVEIGQEVARWVSTLS